MQIVIATPTVPSSTRGNSITAIRWAQCFRELGHQGVIATDASRITDDTECLVALHAAKSHQAVCRFRELHPQRPLIVAITGTDLYVDLPSGGRAGERVLKSLELADRIVLLEPACAELLPDFCQNRIVVIRQSAPVFEPANRDASISTRRSICQAAGFDSDSFLVCVVGHLRPVKDPFAAAEATAYLPPQSNVRIVQWGVALDDQMRQQAALQTSANLRYHWLGHCDHGTSVQRLVSCDAMVISSIAEGGPAVVSEAIVNAVPIIANKITSTRGLLGQNHPGFYHQQNRQELASLLNRCEQEPRFLPRLKDASRDLQPLFTWEAECRSWRDLLNAI